MGIKALGFRELSFAYHPQTEAVRFTATAEDGRAVVCSISAEILSRFERSAATGRQVVPIFLRHRSLIEMAAIHRYRADPDDRPSRVSLNLEDLKAVRAAQL